MEIDDVKFEDIKNQTKKYYDGLGKTKCPYLGQEVHFNSFGFEHLLTKSWNRGRSRVEQYTRLRLMRLAVRVIENSHMLQEYDERKSLVRQKINSRWEQRAKNIFYYVFIAMFPDKGVRLKVVIKQIEGGSPFFWSIYPSWKIEKDGNGNDKKVFYSGNLEED